MIITSSKPNVWKCRYHKEGVSRLLVVYLKNKSVHTEDGPENPSARAHEGMGGKQSFKNFLQSPSPWTKDFPDLARSIRRAVSSFQV